MDLTLALVVAVNQKLSARRGRADRAGPDAAGSSSWRTRDADFGGMIGQMLNIATGMKLVQVPYNATRSPRRTRSRGGCSAAAELRGAHGLSQARRLAAARSHYRPGASGG